MPVRMAELWARRRWTSARAAWEVIQRLAPERSATRPSRLMAVLAVTPGSPKRMRLTKPRLRRVASPSPSPMATAIPASASARQPLPWTAGLGSVMARITRAIPAPTSDSVQGGVRPWWQQGSKVT